MEFIPQFYKDVITWNSEGNFYERMPKKPMKNKNKFLELFSIIEAFTNEKINHANWEYPQNHYEHYHSDQDCICSENDCRHLFFKTHIRTGFTFKFGSECILKFHDVKDDVKDDSDDEKKKDEEKFHKKTIQNFKKDTCKYKQCEEKVLDKRKRHCKDGYCSIECQENDIPLCSCGIKCKSQISKKNNVNRGKRYFSCSNSRLQNGQWKNGCCVFKWAHELNSGSKVDEIKKTKDVDDFDFDFELSEEDFETIDRLAAAFYEGKSSSL